jgi:hypothetical protein
MNGMDAVNQIRSAPSKAFRFMQTNRGVALSDGRCAQARTRFTAIQRFAKAKLCPSTKAFYAFANLSRLHVGVRIAQQPVDFRSSPRTREMSERSPDCATRNPGLTARLAPDFVSLNPGYACCFVIAGLDPAIHVAVRPFSNYATGIRLGRWAGERFER